MTLTQNNPIYACLLSNSLQGLILWLGEMFEVLLCRDRSNAVLVRVTLLGLGLGLGDVDDRDAVSSVDVGHVDTSTRFQRLSAHINIYLVFVWLSSLTSISVVISRIHASPESGLVSVRGFLRFKRKSALKEDIWRRQLLRRLLRRLLRQI